jgi:glutamate N-acetyltransferase/amino-acid N-acetyltransferase
VSEIFASRWAGLPGHARELNAAAPLPAGFRAAGVAAGIKRGGELDLGLLVCDTPGAVSAARFGVSSVPAAPVQVSKERCELGALRGVIVNSGNANAATGAAGYASAATMQEAAADVLGLEPREVAVASTGVIGAPLASEPITAGAAAAGLLLGAEGALNFATAIRTTDVLDKHAALELELTGGTVRLSAQCKGAGMISPRFATLLCFVQSDAVLARETADLLLGVTVKRSFDRISVDGQLSTNDTVLLIASGASGVEVVPESEDELRFGEALDALLRALALRIVADGEGAKRIGRVHVRGGDGADCEAVARAVANSPLVKAALFGGDANWGRIAQAIGAALPGRGPLAFDIAIEGVLVCAGGAGVEFDAAALGAAVSGPEVEYVVTLPGEGAECEVFFSDLSYGYVKINAEYTT